MYGLDWAVKERVKVSSRADLIRHPCSLGGMAWLIIFAHGRGHLPPAGERLTLLDGGELIRVLAPLSDLLGMP